ncbi:MAG: HNH endonuclease [Thermodesulfobacteriota bacterium]
MNIFDGMDGVPEEEIRRQRDEARKLRKSRWWQEKIGRGLCHWCGGRFAPGQLTMDHIIPLARGGQSSKNNCVPCCKQCNNEKKTSLPPELEKL